jgi:hypothetical protein
MGASASALPPGFCPALPAHYTRSMRSAILFIVLSPCVIAQDTARIEGMAIDAVTRQPMAGVHITMQTASDVRYGAIIRQHAARSLLSERTT